MTDTAEYPHMYRSNVRCKQQGELGVGYLGTLCNCLVNIKLFYIKCLFILIFLKNGKRGIGDSVYKTTLP